MFYDLRYQRLGFVQQPTHTIKNSSRLAKNADDNQIPSSAWYMLIILQGRLQSLIGVSLSGAVPHPACVPVLRERTQSRF